MILNYIKLAWRVLGRKKFFTFISLFGISFTLMVLMVLTSFIESELGNNPPLSEKDKMVILNQLTLRKEYFDTIPKIDSAFLDGKYVYDTTQQINSAGQSMSSSSYSDAFIQNHLTDLENVSSFTVVMLNSSFDAYINNSKIRMDIAYTDHHYWDIFNHVFLEGKGFDETALENGETVAVITDVLAKKYFGTDQKIVGRELEFDSKVFKVIGLIKNPAASIPQIQKDVYVPKTARDVTVERRRLKDFFGGFSAVFLGTTASSVKSIKDQLAYKEKNIPMPPEEDFDILEMNAKTYQEYYANRIIYDENPEKSKKILYAILISLFALFIILPSLNLINLNVSRILERSSEIGVRKSFGASRRDILFQFITENLIQTILGGIIGFLMALAVIKIINDSSALQNAKLTINFNFVILCLFITILFGVLSALIPAYKMAKIHIVNALKSNQL